MAQRYAPGFGLAISPVPLKMQVAPVAMVWSARADREPGAAWLRAEIRQILASYAKPADKVLNGGYSITRKRNVKAATVVKET